MCRRYPCYCHGGKAAVSMVFEEVTIYHGQATIITIILSFKKILLAGIVIRYKK